MSRPSTSELGTITSRLTWLLILRSVTDETARQVLDLSVTIEPGQKVGIVGRTGRFVDIRSRYALRIDSIVAERVR